MAHGGKATVGTDRYIQRWAWQGDADGAVRGRVVDMQLIGRFRHHHNAVQRTTVFGVDHPI